jgi:hypothetical protein
MDKKVVVQIKGVVGREGGKKRKSNFIRCKLLSQKDFGIRNMLKIDLLTSVHLTQ